MASSHRTVLSGIGLDGLPPGFSVSGDDLNSGSPTHADSAGDEFGVLSTSTAPTLINDLQPLYSPTAPAPPGGPSALLDVDKPPSFLDAITIVPLPGINSSTASCSIRRIPSAVNDYFMILNSSGRSEPHFRDCGLRANSPCILSIILLYVLSFIFLLVSLIVGFEGFIHESSEFLVASVICTAACLLLLLFSLPIVRVARRYDVFFHSDHLLLRTTSALFPQCLQCCFCGRNDDRIKYEHVEEFGLKHSEETCCCGKVDCESLAFEVELILKNGDSLTVSNRKSFEEAELIRGELMLIFGRKGGREDIEALEQWED